MRHQIGCALDMAMMLAMLLAGLNLGVLLCRHLPDACADVSATEGGDAP